MFEPVLDYESISPCDTLASTFSYHCCKLMRSTSKSYTRLLSTTHDDDEHDGCHPNTTTRKRGGRCCDVGDADDCEKGLANAQASDVDAVPFAADETANGTAPPFPRPRPTARRSRRTLTSDAVFVTDRGYATAKRILDIHNTNTRIHLRNRRLLRIVLMVSALLVVLATANACMLWYHIAYHRGGVGCYQPQSMQGTPCMGNTSPTS